MGGKFKFFIDSVEVTEPIGWDEATITIERDDTIRGLLYGYTSEVTFFDDGYTALKDLFDTGFCNNADVLVQYACEETFADLFEGLIFMTDCTFDLDRCQVTCTINDNHFSGKIANNKAIRAQIDVGRSKNDTVIAAATETTVNMFVPSTGAGSGVAREAYSIYDLFDYLIDFVSDGTLNFDSVYFGVGGAGEDFVITTGAAIRDTAADHPVYTSFEDAFTNIDKWFNISFYIDTTTANPTVWIEPSEDVFETANILSITNVPGINLTVDDTRLFSVVKFGGNTTQDDDGAFQFPDGQFFGHKDEEYHTLGECNIDNTLDLVTDWIADSNVIEDIIVNSVTDYDEDIFIIETDGAGAAVESDIFAVPPATTPVIYNPSLVNSAVADRWFGGVHNSIALYLGDGDDGFSAYKATTVSYSFPPPTTQSTEPELFPTEVSDPNANYTAASSYYTCPADGSYTFRAKIGVEGLAFTGVGAKELDITVELRRYKDNTFADLMQVISKTVQFTEDGGGQVISEGTFYLNVNEVVRVKATYAEGAANAQAIAFDVGGSDTYSITTSTFKTTNVTNGGGIYKEYNPEDFRNLLYLFNYPLSYTDFSGLLGSNKQKINFEIDAGWIKKLDYSIKSGLGEFEIITN